MAVYKDEKRGTWFVSFGYRENGSRKTIVRRGFKSETAAKRAERRLITEIKTKTATTTTSRTLESVGLEYLESIKTDIKEHTYNGYEYKIKSLFPKAKISQLTPQRLNKWRSELGYSTRYKNEIIHLLKTILRYALKQRYIYTDPSADLNNFKKTYEDSKEHKVIDPALFLDTWRGLSDETVTDKVFRVFVYLAYFSGARRAELKGLMFKDYDGKSININKSVTGKQSDRNEIEMTKTKSSVRIVELDNKTIAILDEYIKWCKEHGLYNPDWFLFGGQRAFPNNTIQYAFKRMGLGCRFHDLRHSHATFLIQSGVPINVVSHRLGHSSVEMTLKVYTHLIHDKKDVSVDVINLIVT